MTPHNLSTDATVTLRPANRNLLIFVGVLLVAGWITSTAVHAYLYLNAKLIPDPKAPWAMVPVTLVGLCCALPPLLWGFFGYTRIQLDERCLTKTYWIRATRIGRPKVLQRAEISNLRMAQYTRTNKNGTVTRYALDLEYRGKPLRLITEPSPNRIQSLMQGILRPLITNGRESEAEPTSARS